MSRVQSNVFSKLNVSWRKAVRRIYRIPHRTHNWPVYLLANHANSLPPHVSTEIRIHKFMYTIINSESKMLQYVGKQCFNQSLSNMGNNLSFLSLKDDMQDMLRYKSKDRFFNEVTSTIRSKWYNIFTNEQNLIHNVCYELIECRCNISETILSYQECCDLIAAFCTD